MNGVDAKPTTSHDPVPFIIVGGGIGGLATALALAGKGIRCRLLEQSAEFGEIGAGLQLGPNVYLPLSEIGLREVVLAEVWYPPALQLRDALTGEAITEIPVGSDAFESRFGNPYTVTHRADLLGALLNAVRASDLVTLQNNATVERFDQDEDGVSVALSSGERVRGRALIGADGLWSTIRPAVVGDGAPIVSGHIAYRAVLKRDQVPDDLWQPNVVLWAGPKTHLVHYPLRRGELFNLVAVFHSDKYVEGWDTVGDPDELMPLFAGQRPEVLRLLDLIETWRMWVLCDREPVANWSKGNVTLLGDAAHPMLQYLAQGASMAIEDAVELANRVAETPDDIAGAFERYQQARYLRTAKVQTTARIYGEFYHASGVKAELRKMILGPRTPAQAFDTMNWLYGTTGAF